MHPSDWPWRNCEWYWDDDKSVWLKFKNHKDMAAYLAWRRSARHMNPTPWDLARFFAVRAIPRYHAALNRLLIRAKRLPGVLSVKLFKVLALVRVIGRGGNRADKRSCKG